MIWTRVIEWFTTDPFWRDIRRHIQSPTALVALDIARREIGHGEHGGNNQGPDLDRYRDGKGKGSWCAAFVFYCLLMAFEAARRPMPIKRTHGARKLFRRVVACGWLVKLENVLPGDVVLWARGPQGSWKAHIGIVSRVEREPGKTTRWWYIAGNEGPYPARVQEEDGTEKKRRIGFARVG